MLIKTAFYVSRRMFSGKWVVFGRKFDPWIFSGSDRKLVGPLVKTSRQEFWKALYKSRGMKQRKMFVFENRFLKNVSKLWAKVFFVLSKKFQQCCRNWFLRVQQNFLRRVFCFEKKSFFVNFSWNLIGRFSDFRWKISQHGF